MIDLNQITEGLKASCATVSGLRVTSFAADQINPPTMVFGEYEVDFHKAMQKGLTLVKHTGRLYVSRATDRSAQAELAKWIPLVWVAIEADDTLGGAAQTLIVTSTGRAGVYSVANVDYIGIDFNIDVYA